MFRTQVSPKEINFLGTRIARPKRFWTLKFVVIDTADVSNSKHFAKKYNAFFERFLKHDLYHLLRIQRIVYKALILRIPDCQNRGQDERKSVMPVRARFVLVVSGLKPDPRTGDMARCWLQIWHDQACMGCAFAWLASGLAFDSQAPWQTREHERGK